MNSAQKTFFAALNRQLWTWRGGMLLCSAARLLRLALALLIAALLLDYFLAMAPMALVAVDLLLGVILLFFTLWEVISAWSLSRREAAERADRLLGDRRQPVLTALELQSGTAVSSGPWRDFLVDKVLGNAGKALSGISIGRAFPGRELRKQLGLLLAATAVFVCLYALQPQAVSVVFSRFLHPSREIPPYSKYQFAVTPTSARVLYGGSIELSAKITGAPVHENVTLLTRRGEVVDQSICFRQNDTLFSARLDKIVDPLEFCFVVGRYRSEWLPMEIMLRPKVAMLKLGIEPPTYTQLPATDLVLAQETFEGYRGSKIRLQLTSNRPLARGALRLVPLNGVDEPRAVAGTKSGLHTLEFAWDLKEPARVEIRVEDVQGTSMAEPLLLTQKVLPDRPPEVVLHSPPPYVLATPSSSISVQGTASDDLGLRSVDLIRAVMGYRDRSASLGPLVADKTFAVKRELDLKKLGVTPGQVIELFLEGRDFNPERTGIGSSGISRVEIISDEEYAEMVRANETMDKFAQRYEAVAEQFGAFQKTIEELAKEMQKAQPDKDRINALLKQAREQNQRAQSLFEKLGKELQAFDFEGGWNSTLNDIAERFKQHENLLWGMTADSAQLKEALSRLQRDLELEAQKIAKQQELTEEFLKAGRVMEQSSRFMEILNRQRDLVRRMQRFQADGGDARTLRDQGNQQAAILKELEAFSADLQKYAEALPKEGELMDLRDSALDFVAKLKESGAAGLMQQAVDAAARDNAAETLRYAQLAKERLEELLSKNENSAFGGMCKGQMKFGVRDELNQSLGQLLSSLMGRGRRNGNGQQGAGATPAGGSGDANDGYSVQGHTRANTPVIGPERSQFVPGGRAKGERGQGGQGASSVIQENRSESATGPDVRTVTGRSRAPELAPEKYRQALKRYFNQPETKP